MVGDLTLHHQSFRVTDAPSQVLVVHQAEPGRSEEALALPASLAASRTAERTEERTASPTDR